MKKPPRRERLKAGKRVLVTVNLSPESLKILAKVKDGNRSHAIDHLAQLWREKQLTDISADA